MTSFPLGLRAFAPLLASVIVASAGCSVATGDSRAADAVMNAAGKALEKIPSPEPKPRDDALLIDPPLVTFGMINTGATASRTVVMMNQRPQAVTITDMKLAGDNYELDALPKLPATLSPRDRIEFRVLYRPRFAGWASGKITIWTNESKQVVSVNARAR
jgi:hypothetical protein